MKYKAIIPFSVGVAGLLISSGAFSSDKGFHFKEKHAARAESAAEVKKEKSEYKAAVKDRKSEEKRQEISGRSAARAAYGSGSPSDFAKNVAEKTVTPEKPNQRLAEAKAKESKELKEYQAAKTHQQLVKKENSYLKRDTR